MIIMVNVILSLLYLWWKQYKNNRQL